LTSSASRSGHDGPALGGIVICFALVGLGAFTHISASADEPPRLSVPLDCEPEQTCFIQQYVDIDPGPGALDFRCGTATYDGHKGTDFRVRSAAAARDGVRVLAAAEGVVKGLRDGMVDIFATEKSRDTLAGRECGNGVVIDHGAGWETQYCHLKRGSIGVEKGETVIRGQYLGDVGYSGLAQFAHLHLSVRHLGKVIDPFAGITPGDACVADANTSGGLWEETAARAFHYSDGRIFAAGFAAAPPDFDQLDDDHRVALPMAASAAMVFYARAVNLREGDRLRLQVIGPDGFAVDTPGEPMPRAKATFSGFAGKKLRGARWPAGRYEGVAEVRRGDTVVSTMRVALDLE